MKNWINETVYNVIDLQCSLASVRINEGVRITGVRINEASLYCILSYANEKSATWPLWPQTLVEKA